MLDGRSAAKTTRTRTKFFARIIGGRYMLEEKDRWYQARGIKELLPIRDSFFEYHGKQATCTCDKCIDSTRCSCAYDAYNNNGDCLLAK